MTGNPATDLFWLLIAAAVYALVRWLQWRFPDPPSRRKRRRPKPPPEPAEDDDA